MAERIRHYLRAPKGSELPQAAIFFDTETHPEVIDDKTVRNVLTFGWASYIRRSSTREWTKPDWYRFETPADFWRWVESKTRDGTKLYLFCHNTNFDLPVLTCFKSLRKRGWKLLKAIIEGPPTILTFRKGRASICIIDTLNFWRQKLESIGKSVGVPKLDMPAADAPRAVWDTYCRRDVEVLMRAMFRWWETITAHDFGGFAPTIASQSMRIWRHRHMKDQVLVHDDEQALMLERAAYVGGRNECFRIGKIREETFYLDLKSAYPKVMLDELYPATIAGVGYGPAESTLPLADKGYGVAAEVLVNIEKPVAPRLIDGKLCFPVGRFWTVLTGPEIDQVKRVGKIEDIGWSGAWVMKPLFRSFVEELFNLRAYAIAVGDECQALFFKILLNSLYGKFGQNGFKWDNDRWEEDQPDGSWIEYDYRTGETRYCRRLAGLTQAKKRDAEARESIPIIAAFVTAHQRVKLWNLIDTAGLENTFYCDTDGLLVSRRGYARLEKHLKGTGLGALEVKGVEPHCEIRGLKDYTFGKENHVKGVRDNATWLDAGTIVQDQWSGLKGAALKGTLDEQTIRRQAKHITRVYTKGVVTPQGRVTPLVLNECPTSPLLPARTGRRR